MCPITIRKGKFVFRMRRRAVLAVMGGIAIAGCAGDETEETDEPDNGEAEGDDEREGIEALFTDSYTEPGLTTAVSDQGATIAFGFRDGLIALYDPEGDDEWVDGGPERQVTSIYLSDSNERVATAWIDGNVYGSLAYGDDDSWMYEIPELWAIDATEDANTVAAVTNPIEGVGAVSVTSDNEIVWEERFAESIGWDIAITDTGSHIAVGAGEYYEGAADVDTTGTDGVLFYTGDGVEQWIYETNSEIISIAVNEQQELVYAGTNEGALIVLDFAGSAVWENDIGGYIAVSGDGSTVASSTSDGIIAFDGETGDELWRSEVGYMAFEDISINGDGTRVLTANRGEGQLDLIEEGEVIWNNMYEEGPVRGDISTDGSTWSVIVQNNNTEEAQMEAYRDYR